MANIVFVETSQAGIEALKTASEAGHRVWLITSAKFASLYSHDDLAEIRKWVEHFCLIDDSRNMGSLIAALTEICRHAEIDAVAPGHPLCARPAINAARHCNLAAVPPSGPLLAALASDCQRQPYARGTLLPGSMLDSLVRRTEPAPNLSPH